ncbi:MAG: esterase [Burkholderiaceae bacterium]|nr:MAG: esterase [Burkholderiaceae bacterium]
MPTTHLLYLHGFRSSPQSHKAQLMQAHVRAMYPTVHWWCPQLPPSPRAAAALIESGTTDWPRERMAVVGSSLGGYYATWWAERTGARAALLNPAVDPARDLAAAIGEQTAWHDPTQHFFFRPEYIAELRALATGPLSQPERTFALIAQGDEVLDWREMAARYRGATLRVLPGGDHALSGFATHLGAVCDFLQLAR